MCMYVQWQIIDFETIIRITKQLIAISFFSFEILDQKCDKNIKSYRIFAKSHVMSLRTNLDREAIDSYAKQLMKPFHFRYSYECEWIRVPFSVPPSLYSTVVHDFLKTKHIFKLKFQTVIDTTTLSCRSLHALLSANE